MNWDRIQGNWKQFKGNAKEQWGKLTDDQLDVIAGQREQMAGKIQELYGLSKHEAEKQIADWQAVVLEKMHAMGRDDTKTDAASTTHPKAN